MAVYGVERLKIFEIAIDISLSAVKNTIFLNIIEVLIGIHLNCPVLKICLAGFETWYIYFNTHMISERNGRRKRW